MTKEFSGATFLVTGGAGFIGSFVVERLLELEPKRIIIIDNLLRGSQKNLHRVHDHTSIEFIEGDICNTALVESFMATTDYCFHLAALRINACAADPVRAYDVMVKATFDIVELARRYKIKKLIYSSSASVYGLADEFPTTENAHPYSNQTFYGAAKLWGEQLLRSYHHMYGLNYVALRYFNAYGPRMDTYGKYTEVMIKWLDCIRDQRAPTIMGDGSTSMDFVHVEDIAWANIQALLKPVNDDVFNIASGRETSLKELLILLLQVNQCKLEPVFAPANQVNPVSRRVADISKAQRLLDFKAEVSLEEGLQQLSQWYFEQKKL